MKKSAISMALISLGFGSAMAQTQQFAPAAIKTESGIDFTPTLQAKLSHDNNLANTSADEISSWVLEVTPSLFMNYLEGANQYNATVALAKGNHFSSSQDNYLDIFADANALIELNQAHRFAINLNAVSGHESRGTGVSEGLGRLPEEPVEFDTYSAKGHYEFGAMSTPARIRLLAGYFDKEFSNFEQLTQYRNYKTVSVGGMFFYDTQATTRLVAEVTQDNIRYDLVDPTGNRDSDSRKYRVGLDWEATALTSGTARIGYQQKDFTTNQRADFSGVTWDASVSYQPLSYTTFKVSTGREAKDPNVVGDYIKETRYGASWMHNWSEALSSSVGYNYSSEKYTGVAREDKVNSYSVAADYLLLTNVSLGLGVALTDKDSTVANIKFDKTVYYFTVRAGF